MCVFVIYSSECGSFFEYVVTCTSERGKLALLYDGNAVMFIVLVVYGFVHGVLIRVLDTFCARIAIFPYHTGMVAKRRNDKVGVS